MFIVFIGETEISRIPGISAAGANVSVLPYTGPSDADTLFYDKPRVADMIPLDPQGHPSPVLTTKAALLEANIPYMVARVGSTIAPTAPFVQLSSEISKDSRFGKAVTDKDEIIIRSTAFAKSIAPGLDRVVLGESVPGGTTTALLLLRALGYDGTVSSAGPENPLAIKEQVWKDVCARLNIERGGLKGKGYEAAAEVGDSMQIAVAAFVRALPKRIDVTLAGGTQMLAVAALLRDLGEDRPLTVATTKYVYEDPTGCVKLYGKALNVKLFSAPLDFSKSRFKGLSEYELGFIKEGVGMGGAVMYAMQKGVTIVRLTEKTEELYEQMAGDKKF